MVCLCIAFVLFLVALGVLSCWCASHNFWCWPGRGFSHVVQCWFLILLHSLMLLVFCRWFTACVVWLTSRNMAFVLLLKVICLMLCLTFLRDDACSSWIRHTSGRLQCWMCCTWRMFWTARVIGWWQIIVLGPPWFGRLFVALLYPVGAQSSFDTSPHGCWFCSTSFPGGNQVDGFPPAPILGGMFCAQTLIARDPVVTFERRSKVTKTYV